MRRQGGHSQMHMAEVVLKNLKKIYPNTEKKKKKGEPEKKNDLQITDEGVVAVQDFNLHIADKEFIVLVGPSGCGKSTTLRMIAGLEDISGGELYIDGKLMNDVEPKDRDIAMVFQSYALYPHMTVYGNMAFSLKLKKVPKDEIDRRVRQAAEILDITQYLDRKPKALSGGQRQRVAIGRAIVRDPAVFLMDEPLSNLDAKLRNQMRAELIKLRERIDTTFIYVTHDQTEAMTLGDRIVIMKHLSGGERQRIAIARAMLKNAPVVILDEATAYIDPENEAVVQRAVAKLVEGKTVIVIAHRLSTITGADQIVVVKDGSIEAQGRHEDLLRHCPLYADLWQAHMGAKEGETV